MMTDLVDYHNFDEKKMIILSQLKHLCFHTFMTNQNDKELSDKNILIKLIIILFDNVIVSSIHNCTNKCVFSSPDVKMSLVNYIERCVKYLDIQYFELVMSIILLDTLITNCSNAGNVHLMSYVNIHKLFATSVTVTMKFSCDHFPIMSQVCEILCMTREQYRECELAFLNILACGIWIPPEIYKIYDDVIMRKIKDFTLIQNTNRFV